MNKKNIAIISVLMLFFIAGCAAPQPKLRYVWPPLPDEPKIEYLGVYNNDGDMEKEGFANKILGSDISQFALKNPQMAASDGHGRVFVTDLKLHAVVVFDFNAKKVSLLGGDAAIGTFGQPTGIALDGDGYIYVADSAKSKILVFTPQGSPFGNLDLSSFQLKSIGFIAIDKQRKRIIVPDPKDNKVHVVDFKGALITTITNEFNRPNAVAVAPNGDIVVADSFNARVVVFSSDGKYLSEFGERGENPGQFNLIQGIAVDSGGHIYITDARASRFSVMGANGETFLVVGSDGDSRRQIGVFQVPFGISIDQNDTIYIVEKYFSRFQIYQFLTAEYLVTKPLDEELLAKPINLKDSLSETKEKSSQPAQK